MKIYIFIFWLIVVFMILMYTRSKKIKGGNDTISTVMVYHGCPDKLYGEFFELPKNVIVIKNCNWDPIMHDAYQLSCEEQIRNWDGYSLENFLKICDGDFCVSSGNIMGRNFTYQDELNRSTSYQQFLPKGEKPTVSTPEELKRYEVEYVEPSLLGRILVISSSVQNKVDTIVETKLTTQIYTTIKAHPQDFLIFVIFACAQRSDGVFGRIPFSIPIRNYVHDYYHSDRMYWEKFPNRPPWNPKIIRENYLPEEQAIIPPIEFQRYVEGSGEV